ncbi:MAG TPA: hypothetical protein VLF89_07235 [Candidatus Saccharimonadales bacterium]|nr:hypothetical protein [Candidatus Saccharimonadales bacterium]
MKKLGFTNLTRLVKCNPSSPTLRRAVTHTIINPLLFRVDAKLGWFPNSSLPLLENNTNAVKIPAPIKAGNNKLKLSIIRKKEKQENGTIIMKVKRLSTHPTL